MKKSVIFSYLLASVLLPSSPNAYAWGENKVQITNNRTSDVLVVFGCQFANAKTPIRFHRKDLLIKAESEREIVLVNFCDPGMRVNMAFYDIRGEVAWCNLSYIQSEDPAHTPEVILGNDDNYAYDYRVRG